jgi:hypothetical protein
MIGTIAKFREKREERRDERRENSLNCLSKK